MNFVHTDANAHPAPVRRPRRLRHGPASPLDDASGHRDRHDPERGQPPPAPAGGLRRNAAADPFERRAQRHAGGRRAGERPRRTARWPGRPARPLPRPGGAGKIARRRGSALADYWLLRRLPRFTRAHRRLEVELGIVENELQARAADADVQILWQPIEAARSTSTQRLLFHEQVFPVCAPHLLPGGRLLRDPTGLAELPLVHKGPPGGRGQGAEWSWPVWFGRLGIERRPPAGLRCAALGTAIAAALEGAGVVLARSLLVHDALADGRLVRVLHARGTCRRARPIRALAGGVGRRPACANLRRLDRGRGQSDDGEARSAPQRPRTDLRLTKEPCGCRADFDQDGTSFSR